MTLLPSNTHGEEMASGLGAGASLRVSAGAEVVSLLELALGFWPQLTRHAVAAERVNNLISFMLIKV